MDRIWYTFLFHDSRNNTKAHFYANFTKIYCDFSKIRMRTFYLNMINILNFSVWDFQFYFSLLHCRLQLFDNLLVFSARLRQKWNNLRFCLQHKMIYSVLLEDEKFFTGFYANLSLQIRKNAMRVCVCVCGPKMHIHHSLHNMLFGRFWLPTDQQTESERPD